MIRLWCKDSPMAPTRSRCPTRSSQPSPFTNAGIMRRPTVAKPARLLRHCFRLSRAISITASLSTRKCDNGTPRYQPPKYQRTRRRWSNSLGRSRRAAARFISTACLMPSLCKPRTMLGVTANTAHATFPNDLQWLRLDPPMHELRWPDGTHLDDRSSIIVAKELQKQFAGYSPVTPGRD